MTDIAASSVPIQQESLQYDKPVSEAAASAIGALANYLRQIVLPVGSCIFSMLFDEGDGTHPSVNFQSQLGNPSPSRWVLADGRSCAGSTYEALTGQSTVPDMRGVFTRGANYGGSVAGTRADGKQDPDGTKAPGDYTADKVGTHDHDAGAGINFVCQTGGAGVVQEGGRFGYQATTGMGGENETAPKNVAGNWFIRIN